MSSNQLLIIISLTVSLIFPTLNFGQSVALELLHEHFLKVENDNYIKIVSSSVHCDSIILEADAEIQYKGNCIWIVNPKKLHKPFSFELNVYEKRLNDTIKIERKIYRTEILDPLGVNFKLSRTSMTKEALINIGEIRTFEKFSSYRSYDSKVKSFRVLALRNNEVLFYHDNQGFKFSNTLKAKLNELKEDDILHFIDIQNLEIDSIYLHPKSFKIQIKDIK